MQRGPAKKISKGKKATLKIKRGSSKRSLREKEALAKYKNFQQTYTFTKVGSANLTVEGDGDAF
jgi:hypothetical protein